MTDSADFRASLAKLETAMASLGQTLEALGTASIAAMERSAQLLDGVAAMCERSDEAQAGQHGS